MFSTKKIKNLSQKAFEKTIKRFHKDKKKDTQKNIIVAPETKADPVSDIAFFRAISARNVEQVERLIEAGINVNAENGLYRTALQLVVTKNDLCSMQILKLLLTKGADANQYRQESLHQSESPLSIAVRHNNPEAIKLLLPVTDKHDIVISGISLPWYAEMLRDIQFFPNRIDLLSVLKEYGADFNVKFSCDGAPKQYLLRYAVRKLGIIRQEYRAIDTRYLEFLLENGADPNMTDENLKTPLHTILQESYEFEEKDAQNYEQIIVLLLSHGADLNARDKFLNTPLHYAVKHANEEAVIVLLENGALASLYMTNKKGETPLQLTQSWRKGRNRLDAEQEQVLMRRFNLIEEILISYLSLKQKESLVSLTRACQFYFFANPDAKKEALQVLEASDLTDPQELIISYKPQVK